MTDALQALSTPRRREILRLVWDAERRAGEIREAMPDVSFAAVSQHLKRLEQAGLVAARSEGRCRYYVARRQALGPLRHWLEETWGDALGRLKLQAELEAARRGPRARRARTPDRTRHAARRRR